MKCTAALHQIEIAVETIIKIIGTLTEDLHPKNIRSENY